MQKRALAQAVVDIAQLKGSFELRSGLISDTYFDKYRFESEPKLLNALADAMVRLIPEGTQILAGLELGGIPLATALSLKTGIPQIFVRKERKTYGTKRLAEGPDFAGRQVTIIEDIISTGGAVIDGTRELRADGADVASVVCVILRREDIPEGLSDIGLDVTPLFKLSDLPVL
jgi:orotate phosphoribosyltransferase